MNLKHKLCFQWIPSIDWINVPLVALVSCGYWRNTEPFTEASRFGEAPSRSNGWHEEISEIDGSIPACDKLGGLGWKMLGWNKILKYGFVHASWLVMRVLLQGRGPVGGRSKLCLEPFCCASKEGWKLWQCNSMAGSLFPERRFPNHSGVWFVSFWGDCGDLDEKNGKKWFGTWRCWVVDFEWFWYVDILRIVYYGHTNAVICRYWCMHVLPDELVVGHQLDSWKHLNSLPILCFYLLNRFKGRDIFSIKYCWWKLGNYLSWDFFQGSHVDQLETSLHWYPLVPCYKTPRSHLSIGVLLRCWQSLRKFGRLRTFGRFWPLTMRVLSSRPKMPW